MCVAVLFIVFVFTDTAKWQVLSLTTIILHHVLLKK